MVSWPSAEPARFPKHDTIRGLERLWWVVEEERIAYQALVMERKIPVQAHRRGSAIRVVFQPDAMRPRLHQARAGRAAVAFLGLIEKELAVQIDSRELSADQVELVAVVERNVQEPFGHDEQSRLRPLHRVGHIGGGQRDRSDDAAIEGASARPRH